MLGLYAWRKFHPVVYDIGKSCKDLDNLLTQPDKCIREYYMETYLMWKWLNTANPLYLVLINVAGSSQDTRRMLHLCTM